MQCQLPSKVLKATMSSIDEYSSDHRETYYQNVKLIQKLIEYIDIYTYYIYIIKLQELKLKNWKIL